MKKTPKTGKWFFILIAGVILVLAARTASVLRMAESKKDDKEVITVSTLEKIIHVSELSAFTEVYNGIAQVMNKEKPEEIDYYVSYEAKVNVGIDLEKITIAVDNAEKLVTITIPEVYITDLNVDIGSMDYIFVNDKANTALISQEAFQACEADVRTESQQQKEIFELAAQNAENIITALTRPIIEQLDAEYVLVIEREGS